MNVQVKRRTFLKLVGGSVGALAITPAFEREQAVMAHPSLHTPVAPVARNPVWHLLSRTSFGPRPSQAEAVTGMGIGPYLHQQLYPASIDDSAMEAHLRQYQTLTMSAAQLVGLEAAGRVGEELVEATILRNLYSERQLFEVMTLFWSEHFSIQQEKGACSILKTVDDRMVIRKHALGNFCALLLASAQSPAMLCYLDNDSSDKTHANENYAREVMELHTIGADNYTERDVRELARCLTGWTWQSSDPQQSDYGTFVFNSAMHDTGPKMVLGQHIPAGGGIEDALLVLKRLAIHPKTARNISLKLYRRFIGDEPSEKRLQAIMATFQQSGGDIPSILKTIFDAPEFWTAPPKYKRPHEYLLSLVRALNLHAYPTRSIGYDLDNLGQRPFAYPTPDGYSDLARVWIGGSLTERWNKGFEYVWRKAQNDPDEDLFTLAAKCNVKATSEAVLDFYAHLLFGRSLTRQEQTIILTFITKIGNLDLVKGRAAMINAIVLLVTSPVFQYR